MCIRDRLKRDGRTLIDLLDELAVAHGVYATDAFSIRVTDLALIPALMTRLRSEVPTAVGGLALDRVEDLSEGIGALPPTDGLRYWFTDRSRAIVRPSGTEPKVKVYLEAVSYTHLDVYKRQLQRGEQRRGPVAAIVVGGLLRQPRP